MEILDKLEERIGALLDRIDSLAAENARLKSQFSSHEGEKDALREENARLRASLENEARMRTEAMDRIDAVLRKIHEHDSVE